MTAVIPRDQAVAEAGALIAADRTEMDADLPARRRDGRSPPGVPRRQ